MSYPIDATLTGFDETDLNDFLFIPDSEFEPEAEAMQTEVTSLWKYHTKTE
ncbi:MAG: hypothetical protein R3C11_29105 [Planctomycetaceae bacterium]